MGTRILSKLNHYNNDEYENARCRKRVLLSSDVLILITAFIISFLVTKDISDFKQNLFLALVTMVIVSIVTYINWGNYETLWSTSVDREIIMILSSTVVSTLISMVFLRLEGYEFSAIFFIIFALITHVLTCFIRILYRGIRRALLCFNVNSNTDNGKRVLIIGGGYAGNLILKEMFEKPHLNMRPVGIIDDDRNKLGKSIYGVPVVGATENIETIAEHLHIDEIVFTIAKIDRKRKREIIQACQKTKCVVKTIPGIYELIDGKVSVKKIRDVNIEDLLGRESVKIKNPEVKKFVKGKRVLVTGAGGSIGSELCRQISLFKPSELVLVDIYENNVYDLQQELLSQNISTNLKVLIASVRDRDRMEEIFNIYKPEVVFHAAAHKHVPLMEDSPCEAIKNNIFGTLNVAQLSSKYNVKRFVLISTDKAVNPTNIMGATKRCCEMIVQTLSRTSNTEFVAVRFGNVLGSNGSVVPLFKKQIEAGGPVTVTHPEITRFFMTIPEAVSLVLQAGAMASGGEIFVLNMGDPVKIVDLARNLITLSGFEPDVDIKIEFTGLRPGEKLYEEILMDEEGLTYTGKEKIYVGQPIEVDEGEFFDKLRHLKYVVSMEDEDEVRSVVKDIVPTYVIKKEGEKRDVALSLNA